MTEILTLENFEKVQGNLCLTVLLPRNSKINALKTKDDLQKVLNHLLRGLKKGEYPFITIPLVPIAYGSILKKR